MSIASLAVRPVVIQTAGARTDAYGDTQPDWTTPTTVAAGGWLAQQSSIEDLDGRAATASTLALFLPAGTVITARNRVVIDARTYEIIGEPHKAWTPRGEHHVEVQLQAVDG